MSPKEILRDKIKSRLEKTSAEEFHAQGISAAACLRSSAVWQQYKTILLFLSMKSEIDTQPLLELALNEGKKVFAPRVEEFPAGKKLVFYPVLSAAGPWERGPYGIREPSAEASKKRGSPPVPADTKIANGKTGEPLHSPPLIITPGLAFGMDGNRLGRGGGFYDRFFSELENEGRQFLAIGLCMDYQLIDRVPVEGNDKKIEAVLTKKGLKFTAYHRILFGGK